MFIKWSNVFNQFSCQISFFDKISEEFIVELNVYMPIVLWATLVLKLTKTMFMLGSSVYDEACKLISTQEAEYSSDTDVVFSTNVEVENGLHVLWTCTSRMHCFTA